MNWEQCWGEVLGVVGWWKTQHEPALYAYNAEGKLYPGLPQISVTSRMSEVVLLLYTALTRAHVQFQGPQHKNTELFEQVQRRTTKMIRRLECLPTGDRLQELGPFSLKKQRLWGDLTAVFQYFKGAYKKASNPPEVNWIIFGINDYFSWIIAL